MGIRVQGRTHHAACVLNSQLLAETFSDTTTMDYNLQFLALDDLRATSGATTRAVAGAPSQRRTVCERLRLARRTFGFFTLVVLGRVLRDTNTPLALSANLVWFAPLYGF